MLIAILAMSILNLIATCLLATRLAALDTEVGDVAAKLKSLASGLSPQALGSRGGRQVPTLMELEAARNRIDQNGVAHPGGS